MKAARDRDDEFHDPARKNDIPGRPQTRLDLWEEHLKNPVALTKVLVDCLDADYDC